MSKMESPLLVLFLLLKKIKHLKIFIRQKHTLFFIIIYYHNKSKPSNINSEIKSEIKIISYHANL